MRPRDWSPLRDSDPTPGDSDAVGDQSRDLGDVAAELRSQISRLRRIGDDGELCGQYADRLRQAATDLIGELRKVEDRYERVAAALRRWEPRLRGAQQSADRLRNSAQQLDDERVRLRRQASGLCAAHLPADPTPAQQALFDADQAAAERIRQRLDDIESELDTLERGLREIEGDLAQEGRAVAREIRAAIDDGITDSLWDDVQGAWRAIDAAVDGIAEELAKWIEALSWIATALAVASVFFPVLAPLAALAAGLVLLGQSVLYVTGNGSLTDVLFAVFSLATAGAGAWAGKAIKSAQAATRTAAAERAGARVASRTQEARARLGRRLGRNITRPQRRMARAELDRLKAEARNAEQSVRNRPLPETSRVAGLKFGDVDNAKHMRDIEQLVAEFPELASTAQQADKALRIARVNLVASTTADLGSLTAGESKLVPDKPYSRGFEDFKSSWGQIK